MRVDKRWTGMREQAPGHAGQYPVDVGATGSCPALPGRLATAIRGEADGWGHGWTTDHGVAGTVELHT